MNIKYCTQIVLNKSLIASTGFLKFKSDDIIGALKEGGDAKRFLGIINRKIYFLSRSYSYKD